MTYTTGGLIQAADYNGFVTNTANANINNVWGPGSGDAGWGQSNVATVSTAATVTATQWATLNSQISTMGSQTGVSLTSRTSPVAGNTISVLANVNTDISNITTYRGNAAGVGTTSSTFSGTISKTASTAANASGWTISFTHVVTFPSADQARYFFNAGGLIRLDMSKTSTGTDKDPEWNTFVGTVGTLYLSGRVNGANQTIAGTAYSGFTRSGGSGSPSPFASTTGWYSLTGGAAATTMFQLAESITPYTGDYIRVTAAVNAGRTTVTFVTTWFDSGYAAPGQNNSISGGTGTASPYTTFGTAPTVLCRYIPPATTYLSNSWGTPTIAGSVV